MSLRAFRPAARGPGSKLALVVLVALAVLSPGRSAASSPGRRKTIALVSLRRHSSRWRGTRDEARFGSRRGLDGAGSACGCWPLSAGSAAGIAAQAPRARLGSGLASRDQEAAAVLGPGPFPISLHPEATRRWLAFTTGLDRSRYGRGTGTPRANAASARNDRTRNWRGAQSPSSAWSRDSLFGNKIYGIWSVPTVAPSALRQQEPLRGLRRARARFCRRPRDRTRRRGSPRPALLSWIESRRAKWIVLAWGTAFVLVLSVVVSLSRGGVVAVSVGLAAFVLLRLWARGASRLSPRGLLVLTALLLTIAIAFVSLLPPDTRARVISLGSVTSEASGSYRIAVWRDTRRLIASSPLVGSGFGAYADALRRFRTAAGEVDVEHAESDVLEAVAEGGAIAAGTGRDSCGFHPAHGPPHGSL
jgi:hypothetical protein